MSIAVIILAVVCLVLAAFLAAAHGSIGLLWDEVSRLRTEGRELWERSSRHAAALHRLRPGVEPLDPRLAPSGGTLAAPPGLPGIVVAPQTPPALASGLGGNISAATGGVTGMLGD